MRKIAISILIFSIPFLSFSQNSGWIKIVESVSGDKYFIDKSRITWDDGIAKTWIKTIQCEKSKKEIISIWIDGKSGDEIIKWLDYEYQLSLEEFYCEGNKRRIISIYNYDKNGNCLNFKEKSSSEPGSLEWESIVPETVSEAIFSSVCKSKNQQKKTQ